MSKYLPTMKLIDGELYKLDADQNYVHVVVKEMTREESVRRQYNCLSREELIIAWMQPEFYSRGVTILNLFGTREECIKTIIYNFCMSFALYVSEDDDDDAELLLEGWINTFTAETSELTKKEMANLNVFELANKYKMSRIQHELYSGLSVLKKQLEFEEADPEMLRSEIIRHTLGI